MTDIFPTHLIDLLTTSITLSFIIMVLIQKFKALSSVNKNWKIFLLNFFFSFLMGIPFSITFYNLGLIDGIWVSIFSFIGAPTIYKVLKNQTILTYQPESISNYVEVPNENVIKR